MQYWTAGLYWVVLYLFQNKNQAEKVSLARKQVKQWVNEGRELAGLPSTDAKGAFSAFTVY